jgi:hypothetical protein
LFILIKRKLRVIGYAGKKSEDGVSAQISALVSGLYSKADLKGLSVLEKNDYLYKNYPSCKKMDEAMCLSLWLIVSVFIGIVAVIFCVTKDEFPTLILLSCILSEMLWGYWVYYKLLQWQLARFVWISGSGLGHSFSYSLENGGKLMSAQDKEICERNILVYQTLCSLLKESTKENKSFLEDISKVRELLEKDKLRHRWERLFSKLEFRKEVFSQAICHFSVSDWERMEQRFAELCAIGDPAALAEKRKDGYRVSFRTMQGDIATIHFIAAHNSKKRLCISQIKRKGTYQFVPMSKNKLRQILEKEDHDIAALYQGHLSNLLPMENKLSVLDLEIKRVESRIQTSENFLLIKEAELLKRRKQVEEIEKECEQIHFLLAKKGLTDEEYEKQKQAFLTAQRRLSSVKADSKSSRDKYEKAKEEYDSLVSKKEVLKEDLLEIGNRQQEMQKHFCSNLQELVRDKKQSGQIDADYLLGELLVKRLEI